LILLLLLLFIIFFSFSSSLRYSSCFWLKEKRRERNYPRE
jgi:hypothetical protein